MTTIAVLGAGIMGSALTIPLAENGHDIRVVGTHLDGDIVDSLKANGHHPGLDLALPDAVRPFHLEEIETAFDGAEVVLSAVNSFGVEWASEQLSRLLKPGVDVVAIAKGMQADEDGNLRVLTDVLADQVPDEVSSQVEWCGIVGPSIAGEVAVRHDTCVVFAGENPERLERLARLFRTDRYHVWISTDIIGAEVGAAMKNCYALGVGMAAGVQIARGEEDSRYRSHNYEAALFAQGAAEMTQMIDYLGGTPDVTRVLPSVGDCYVTSAGGRNVKVGKLLGEGVSFQEARERLGNPTLEGAAAIQVIGKAITRLAERGEIGPDDYPLMRHLYEVVGLEQPLDMPWSSFFGGEPVRV
jgi:glycerol-3-phosphate dehydrogenase (NAD(P)+)